MIKELFDGLKAKVKGGKSRKDDLPPPGGIPLPPLTPPEPPASAALNQPIPPPSDQPSPDDFSTLLGGTTNELDDKVKSLQDKTESLETKLSETLDTSKENRDRLDSIDMNMKKFLSLYELVTNQINPFVDQGPPMPRKSMLQMDEPKEEVEEKIIVPPFEEEPKEEEAEEEAATAPVKEKKPRAEPPQPPADESERVMFLQSVKDGNASFVLEWMTSLVSGEGGLEKNTKFLTYLLDKGWITPKAYDALMAHLNTLAKTGKIELKTAKIEPGTFKTSLVKDLEESQQQTKSAAGLFGKFVKDMPGMDDKESLTAVLEWIRYLVDTVGYDEATEILKYIVQLGWITPDAHKALLNYIEKSSPIKVHKEPGSQPPELLQPTSSRIVITPSAIPTPTEVIQVEERQLRIPVRENTETVAIKREPVYTPHEEIARPQIPIMPAPRIEVPIASPKAHAPPPAPRKRRPELIPLEAIGSDIESLAIVLEWIRYLVDNAGTQGTKRIFTSYLDMGWIGEQVFRQLIKYVDGIKAKEGEDVDYQPTIEDHAASLFYIGKLKNVDITEEDVQAILEK